jgi:hypothetical protein
MRGTTLLEVAGERGRLGGGRSGGNNLVGGRWCMPRARGGHGGSRGREAVVVDTGEGEHTL